MTGNALVALKEHDRVDEVMPFIHQIVQPGMKILFLVPCPMQSMDCWRDRRLSMEAEIQSNLAVRLIKEFPWEAQRRLAVERISPACDLLRERGIEVEIDVYAGSLRKALRSYTHNGDVHWVMMAARGGNPLLRLLQRTMRLLGLPKQPSFYPVFELHPVQCF
jgi:hypothetical protein